MNKDKISKLYFNNERFSDMFNTIIFDGKEVIKSDSLKELNSELISNLDGKVTVNKIRDLLKLGRICECDNVSYILLGIENQTKIDPNMVLRMLMYDALTYNKELEDFNNNKKDDKIKSRMNHKKIYPVVTLIIYYGTRKWTGPKTLYDVLDLRIEELKNYISNYKINIVSLNELNNDEIDKFKTDIKLLINILKCRNDKEVFYDLIRNNKEYQNIKRDTALMIKSYTDLDIIINDEEEINMCKAVRELHEDWKNEGIELGIEIGKTEGIEIGKNEGIEIGKTEGANEYKKETILKLNDKGLTIDEISNLLDINEDYIRKTISKK